MGPYRHGSVTIFLKRYILLKGMFLNAFSSMIMKKKSVNFLVKSVETPQHFSSLSSFIFNILTRLYTFLRALILFLIYKHNDLVQSEQQNWSYSISQLVYSWFDKLSPLSELIYFCGSCWMIFQYLYTLFLIFISLFCLLTGVICFVDNFFFKINQICHILLCCILFYLFPIGFIVSNFSVHHHANTIIDFFYQIYYFQWKFEYHI